MRTIYINGKVYTGNLTVSEAFAVEDGKFIFEGMNNEAETLIRYGDEVVDLNKRFVCSGFNDSHMHLLGYGKALNMPLLDEHTDSLQGMIDYMIKFYENNPVKSGEWMYGRGWNQDYFADVDRMPDRHDLDRVSEIHPVCAVRACGHCLTVNTKAIEMLGITADTPAPEGGTIGIENGYPDGRFYDNAMDEYIFPYIPAPGREDIRQMIKSACAKLNSYGVTSVQTDDYCEAGSWRDVNDIYRQMKESGELTVRVYEQCNFSNIDSFKIFVEEGNVTGSGDEMFRIGPLKLIGDGALGARTAFMSKPYEDAPEIIGLPVFSQDAMDQMVEYANDHNMQIAVHAIGDACLDRVVESLTKALEKTPRHNHRHGIVHCQISRADQLDKMTELGLHIYAQSIFLDYDSHIVEQRVGKELASTSYNWKTLMDRGLSVSNGTDCPVEQPFALGGIQCAVTRRPLKEDIPAFLPEQAFSVCEAIDSYTICGAEGSFEESIKGRIQPGMLADFVILDKSPFEVPENEISKIRVCATYLGGKKVFEE